MEKMKKNKIIGIILIGVVVIAAFFGKKSLDLKKTNDFLKIKIEGNNYQIGKNTVGDFLGNGWKLGDKDLEGVPKNSGGSLPMVKDNKVIIVIWNSGNNVVINKSRVEGVCINKKYNVDFKCSNKSKELYDGIKKKSSNNREGYSYCAEKFNSAFVSVYYDNGDEIVTVGRGDIGIRVSKESFDIIH